MFCSQDTPLECLEVSFTCSLTTKIFVRRRQQNSTLYFKYSQLIDLFLGLKRGKTHNTGVFLEQQH